MKGGAGREVLDFGGGEGVYSRGEVVSSAHLQTACAGKNYLFVDFDSIDDALTVRERIEGRAFGGKTIVVGFRNPPNQFQR